MALQFLVVLATNEFKCGTALVMAEQDINGARRNIAWKKGAGWLSD